MEWKVKVIDKFDEKLKTLSYKTFLKFHKSVFQQNNPLYSLNGIQDQFVVTTVDKANGNVAFICQQFDALFLIKELDSDLNNTGTNKTYIPVHKTDNQVISGHTTFLRTWYYMKKTIHFLTFTGSLSFINIHLKPDL